MKTIWKWELSAGGDTAEMPKGAEIISVQMQHPHVDPQMWAIVDPEAPKEYRKFYVAGTGHPLPDVELKFIDTFQMMNGGLVFHVFEVMP